MVTLHEVSCLLSLLWNQGYIQGFNSTLGLLSAALYFKWITHLRHSTITAVSTTLVLQGAALRLLAAAHAQGSGKAAFWLPRSPAQGSGLGSCLLRTLLRTHSISQVSLGRLLPSIQACQRFGPGNGVQREEVF